MEFGTVFIVIGIVSLFVLEAFFEVAFFSILGTSVRWIFLRNEKNFREIYQAKTKTNFITGIIAFFVIIAIPAGIFTIINN